MSSFEQYLRKFNHTQATVRRYLGYVNAFLQAHPQAEKFTCSDILNYLEELSRQNFNPRARQDRLIMLKKYYDYLAEEGRREDHPCRNLNIKGIAKKGVIFADLFTSAELERLLDREETYPHLKLKNQVIISLLIYQGLLPQEIVQLKVQHINFDEGSIFVKGGRMNTIRKLELHPKQYRLMDEYLDDARKRLLETGEQGTDVLLLNYRGKPATIEDVQFLVETAKGLFPERNLSAKTIRDSVIANMLNEKKLPLEQVQLFAGHRWISSTARYRLNSISEQRELLNKYFPL